MSQLCNGKMGYIVFVRLTCDTRVVGVHMYIVNVHQYNAPQELLVCTSI